MDISEIHHAIYAAVGCAFAAKPVSILVDDDGDDTARGFASVPECNNAGDHARSVSVLPCTIFCCAAAAAIVRAPRSL